MDTDRTESGLPAGYLPWLRALGDRVKSMRKELGFTHISQLHQALPANISMGQENFYKTLNGRWYGGWEALFEAIADVYAERKLRQIRRGGTETSENELDRQREHFRRAIFGKNEHGKREPPSCTTEEFLAPSFERLKFPESPTTFADDFLNAMPPTLADIAAGFDVTRAVYAGSSGIKARTIGWLSEGKGPLLLSISGGSGSGKTVLAQRLAFDCLQAGFEVHRLIPDWLCADALAVQIRRTLTANEQPALFILDNAARLWRARSRATDVFRSVSDIQTPLVLVFAENWPLYAPHELEALSIGEERALHFTVGALSPGELSFFVDKVIELETSGKVRDVRCDLSKSSRLALCQDERDRLPAAALLVFRYGRKISELLLEEFHSIDSPLARRLYTMIVVFAGLGLELPRQLVRRLIRQSQEPEIGVWGNLAHITAQVDDGIGLRHRMFYRHLAPSIISNLDDRSEILTNVICAANPENPSEDQFVTEFFAKPKRISQVMMRDVTALGSWVESSREVATEEFPEMWRGAFLACLGRIARMTMLDNEQAHELFELAIQSDPCFGYAYRERSWNLLHAGRVEDAESSARDAVSQLPRDLRTLVSSATVLQYTSSEGFELAEQVFERARSIDPDDDELLKCLDRYDDAKIYRSHIDRASGDIPDDVLARLRAPWFVWKVRRGVNSAQFMHAIRGKLGALIRDPRGDSDEVDDVVHNIGSRRDKITAALLEGNIARLQYVQWYQVGLPIDADNVDKLFKKALKRAPAEPFIQTWYGTFLKEVRKDLAGAESVYRKAIADANAYRRRDGVFPFRNHPMLLNNLALLLIHLVRRGNCTEEAYVEAEDLLKAAIKEINRSGSRFLWPIETYAELKLLKQEAGIE